MVFLKSVIRFALYWLMLFGIQRILFHYYHADKLIGIESSELWYMYLNGLRLDFAMIGYFLLIPIIFYPISILKPDWSETLRKLMLWYSGILTVLVVLIGVIDLQIYTEWGTKINSRAIDFFLHSPNEAMASSASSPLGILISAFILIVGLFLFLLRRFFQFRFNHLNKSFKNLVWFPLYFLLAVILLRGGVQLIPINQSAVYFSSSPAVNHTSVNTVWNLSHSFLENKFSNENPYEFMDPELARHIVDSIYQYDRSQTVRILQNQRPNIVMVVLESFTSDVVGSFGGDPEVSPNLSRLADEGLAFKNIYASGDRTDRGLIALLSSFPAQAVRSIIQQPEKCEKLPSLTKKLIEQGYDPAFYYGGESEFSNMKSYLLSNGIQHIVDKKNFKPEEMNSKWGAHDGSLFQKVLAEIPSQNEPFFSVVLTLSSHEPFEIPRSSPYTAEDLPTKFKKAAHYTDECIAEFMAEAKKQPWYDNTLFIFVADHGHRLPRRYKHAYNYKKFRIPLIFYGEALKPEWRGRFSTKIGSQTDLAETLYRQMGITDTSLRWSKDLMNPVSPNFAFWSFDNGLGWVDAQQIYTMSNVNKMIVTMKLKRDKDIKNRLKLGRAYMQEVFNTYMNY